jgi:hypothetical protein
MISSNDPLSALTKEDVPENVRPISELLMDRATPCAMQTVSDDSGNSFVLVVAELKDQEWGKAMVDLKEVAEKDLDGDGVPDGWDKYMGRTTADVAAEVYKIGKYAVTITQKGNGSPLLFQTLKSTVKNMFSVLAGAATSRKPQPHEGDLGDLFGGHEKLESKAPFGIGNAQKPNE